MPIDSQQPDESNPIQLSPSNNGGVKMGGLTALQTISHALGYDPNTMFGYKVDDVVSGMPNQDGTGGGKMTLDLSKIFGGGSDNGTT